MKNYNVKITEVLEKIVRVEADSEEKALEIAKFNYGMATDDYILSADNYMETKFSVEK